MNKLIKPGKWCTLFDENGKLITTVYDESFRLLLGYSPEEYADGNTAWTESIHPDDAERVAEYFDEICARHPGGMDYDIEYRMMTKSGYRLFHDWAHCERKEDGTIVRCDGVVFDIQDILNKTDENKLISENYARFFALEDNFESLYDVELESGSYVSFVKGDFYQSNVIDKLVEPTDYFEDLRANIDAVIYPADRDGLYNMLTRENIRRELAENENYDYYYRLNTQAGPVWFKMRVVYKNAEKKNVIIGVFNASKDIEMIKLRRRMNMIYSLSDMFDPIFVLNPETGEYDWYESKAEEIEELTAMSVHGEDFYKDIGIDTLQIIHDDDKKQFSAVYNRENMLKIAATGEIQETENRWRVGPGGTYRWKYNKITRMIDEDGKNYVVVGVIDTTEAKEKEAQQLTNEVLSEYMLKSFKTAYYANIKTGEINMLQATPGIRRQAEEHAAAGGIVDYDSVAALYVSNCVHPADRDRVSLMMSRSHVRSELKSADTFNFTYRDISGKTQGVYRCTVIRGADEDHIAAGFQNITESVRRQEEQQRQLQKAYDEANAANTAKTDFLFSMSHDIRTPMNAIMGFTNMAIKHIDDRKKAVECLEKTQKAGTMLLSLINSVLEVSRIESGHATLEEQKGDVYYSFANIENTLRELADTKDIKLSFEFGDIRNRFVYADFSRCMRVFVNVISNAVKYTPEGGTVKVRCEQVGGEVNGRGIYRYTFTDNGIGMSEEFQKHIFEQFSREKTSTVSGIQGSGLGMSVVKSFVELMGGTVTVKSKQGEGSTFTIVLPFRLQEKEEYTDPDTGEIISSNVTHVKTEEVSFRGRRVLLVEDNELNSEIAAEILGEEGLTVEDANDGTVAVEMMKDMGPDYYDFILMDIQMPVMNGYDATRAIREMYPDLRAPIIALSANAFTEDIKKSLDAGMNAHVAKPINVKELFAVLAKFL